MKTSDTRILTTHAGSLPRSDALLETLLRLNAWGAVDDDELAELVATETATSSGASPRAASTWARTASFRGSRSTST